MGTTSCYEELCCWLVR